MLNDMVVVNGVAHAFNADADNLTDSPVAGQFRDRIWLYHRKFSPDDEFRMTPDEYMRDHSVESVAHALFAESQCDLAAYHSTPIFDFFKDGLSDFAKGVELKRRCPGRVLLYGRIDWTDLPRALREMEEQAEQGADAFKLYPAVYYEGRSLSLRMDDPKLAFPLYDKALELGINNIAVHKAHPFGPVKTDPYRVDDVEEAAAIYPQINFQIVHAGLAFVEDTAMLLARFPNVYGTMEISWSYIVNQPRMFAESLALLLHWASADKLIFADGCSAQHPRPGLERFADFQLPDDLIEGYGVGPITDEDRRKILGENFARIHGIDLEERRKEIVDDEFERLKQDGLRPAWSVVRGKAGKEATPVAAAPPE